MDPQPGEVRLDYPGLPLQGAGARHIRGRRDAAARERLGRGLVTYFRPRRLTASFGGECGLREAGAVPGQNLWLRL